MKSNATSSAAISCAPSDRDRAPLARLLRPKSIAVVGGGVWCANVIAECRRIGFSGPIWPVHPTKDEIGGLPTVPNVGHLPGAPDAAFVGVNAAASVPVVAALRSRGAGGAVCFAAGFREAQAEAPGGAALEAALVEAAGDMRVLGPNTYGFINACDGVALWPDLHGMAPCAHGVAVVTQSSNLALNLTLQQRALPIAYMVTVGNQAQLGLTEIAETLIADPRVTALGLHIEGIDDLPAFVRMVAAARAAGKPVVAIRVGTSGQAREACLSHTASLAGTAAGATALFRRLGIAQVKSPSVFLETLKLAHATGGLASTRIASLSCSGGEAALMADLAEAAGLDVPPLSQAQVRALRAVLGPEVAVANPLDYNTRIWGDTAALIRCFTAMMQADLALGCVVLDTPVHPGGAIAAEWAKVLDAVAAAQRAVAIPIAVLSSLPETMPAQVAEACAARGILALSGMETGLAAIAALAALPRPVAAAELLVPGRGAPRSAISAQDAKAALAAAGLRFPRAVVVPGGDVDAAVQAWQQIGGSVALKVEGFAHKTEAGAVVLDVEGATAVGNVVSRLPPGDVTVEDMVDGAVVELLIGVIRDPAHGYLLTLGAGGVFAELADDTVSTLIPAGRDEVRAMLHRLRLAPRLDGYRGAPGANVEAILDAVDAVQTFVVEHAGSLGEIEINPLLCRSEDAVAVDMLFRQEPAE
ncbi:MAG: acetate--CoA ligase family protein [Pseudomonadota bacterium]